MEGLYIVYVHASLQPLASIWQMKEHAEPCSVWTGEPVRKREYLTFVQQHALGLLGVYWTVVQLVVL